MANSTVHGYPLPDDGEGLDQESWERLVDRLGVGTPVVCASKAEQDAYLAAITDAGFGPSSRSIIRVCRTDLAGLVMRHQGSGWIREWCGDWSVFQWSGASTTDSAGTKSGRGAFSVDLPAASMLDVEADIFAIPQVPSQPWGFWIWLQDQSGRVLTDRRYYNNIPLDSMTARIRQAVPMPAGAGQVQVWTEVHNNSGPIRWANVAISGSYA